MLFDGGFDVVDLGEWRVAGAVLRAAAEEVPVLTSVPTNAALLDEAAVHVALEAAVSAPEAALEVVGVSASTFAGHALCIKDALDEIEHVGLDERGMPTLEGFALEIDLAEVIAIPKHLLDLGIRHGACGAACGWSCEESAVGEFVSDVLVGVVSGGEHLEGKLDEWCSFLVHDYRVDLAAIDVLGDVEVANRSASKRAAVPRLLRHLVGDVGSVLAGTVLIERGQDAVHELADGCGVDGFGRRYERDTALLEVGHHDGVLAASGAEPVVLLVNYALRCLELHRIERRSRLSRVQIDGAQPVEHDADLIRPRPDDDEDAFDAPLQNDLAEQPQSCSV